MIIGLIKRNTKIIYKSLCSHKNLLLYTILNYIDKFFNFLIPFIILKLHGYVYSEIEYLISISLIFSSFTDLGLRQYSFYAYRHSSNNNLLLNQLEYTNQLLIIIYGIITLIGFFSKINILIIYGIYKGIFQTFINIESSITRLRDNPNKVLWINILVNNIIILILVLFYFAKIKFQPIEYIIIYIVFSGLYVFKFILNLKNKIFKIRQLFNIIVSSLKYAYPSIIILCITGIENNIAKIYGYDYLPQETFKYLAILLRFFSIIILAHTSLIGFKSKHIYTSQDNIKKKDIKDQLIYVISAYLLMIILIYISNKLNLFNVRILFNNDFLIISVTYTCMIIRAFIEPYFAKHSRLYLLLIPSLSSFIFIILSLINFRESLNLSLLLFIILCGELISTIIQLIIYKYKIERL